MILEVKKEITYEMLQTSTNVNQFLHIINKAQTSELGLKVLSSLAQYNNAHIWNLKATEYDDKALAAKIHTISCEMQSMALYEAAVTHLKKLVTTANTPTFEYALQAAKELLKEF